MKPVIAAAIVSSAVLSALSGAALAQGRPSTAAMTCAQAAGLVSQRGAIVLATGRDLYDRYVRSPGFCETGYVGRPAFVPARDSAQCLIGYYCSPSSGRFDR